MKLEIIHSEPTRDYPAARVQIGRAQWDSTEEGEYEYAVRFAWPDRHGALTQTATMPLYAHQQIHEVLMRMGAMTSGPDHLPAAA